MIYFLLILPILGSLELSEIHSLMNEDLSAEEEISFAQGALRARNNMVHNRFRKLALPFIGMERICKIVRSDIVFETPAVLPGTDEQLGSILMKLSTEIVPITIWFDKRESVPAELPVEFSNALKPISAQWGTETVCRVSKKVLVYLKQNLVKCIQFIKS